jgi:hypothetical protein
MLERQPPMPTGAGGDDNQASNGARCPVATLTEVAVRQRIGTPLVVQRVRPRSDPARELRAADFVPTASSAPYGHTLKGAQRLRVRASSNQLLTAHVRT